MSQVEQPATKNSTPRNEVQPPRNMTRGPLGDPDCPLNFLRILCVMEFWESSTLPLLTDQKSVVDPVPPMRGSQCGGGVGVGWGVLREHLNQCQSHRGAPRASAIAVRSAWTWPAQYAVPLAVHGCHSLEWQRTAGGTGVGYKAEGHGGQDLRAKWWEQSHSGFVDTEYSGR